MLRLSVFVLGAVWVVGCGGGSEDDAGVGARGGGSAGTASGAGGGGTGSGTGGKANVAGSGAAGTSGAGGTGGRGAAPGGASGAAGVAGAGNSGAANGGAGTSGAGGGAAAGGAGGGGGTAGTAGFAGGSAGQSGAAGTGPVGTPVVYVGGYSQNGQTYPFSTFDLDKASGTLTKRPGTTDAGVSPAYITVAPSGRFLYVANESDDANGGLTALAIGADGALTRLNHQTGSDGGLVHVAVSPDGRFALGASYNGGSVSVFPIEDDGSLGPELDTVDFGMMAQAHAVAFSLSGEHVFVPAKGNDTIEQLLLSDDGMLTPNTPADVAAADGAGPRHIAVHPNGTLAFVINELDSTLTPYTVSAAGVLAPGTPVTTLPLDFMGQNSGAHVEVSPDGRFVYGSNRGDDSIVVFSADQTSGALSFLQRQPTGGRTPRDFDMDPAGEVIVVANQNSDTVAVLRIAGDGTLTEVTADAVSQPDPVAVQIVYLP